MQRTSDHTKSINNHRKRFKYELKKALKAFGELPVEPALALLEETSQNLTRWYRRMFFLDAFHIVLLCKNGGPEKRIYMEEEQIKRNNEFNCDVIV